MVLMVSVEPVLPLLQGRGFGVEGLVVLLQLGNFLVLFAQLASRFWARCLKRRCWATEKLPALKERSLSRSALTLASWLAASRSQAHGLQFLALALEVGLQGFVLLDLLFQLAVFGLDFGGQSFILLAFLLVQVEQHAVDAKQHQDQGHPQQDAAVVGRGREFRLGPCGKRVKRERRNKSGQRAAVRPVPLGVKIRDCRPWQV